MLQRTHSGSSDWNCTNWHETCVGQARNVIFIFFPSRLMNIWRQRNVLLLRCQCAFVAIKREQLPNIHTLIKTIIHTINDTSNAIWGRSSYIALEKMHNFYFNWIWVWALSWFSFPTMGWRIVYAWRRRSALLTRGCVHDNCTECTMERVFLIVYELS